MKRSTEEIKAWYKAKAEMAGKIRAMSENERADLAGRAGTINVEGRPLSIFNTCFLWTQAGRALLQVGGFRQWQKVGRRVIEGQHAAGYIYVPMKKADADGSEKGGEGEEETRMYFKLVPVFDVTQTQEIEAGVIHA